MRKIIGIFSGKGGSGKTTCAVNLGLAIHHLGEKVLVIDTDLENANLGLHLGAYAFPVTLHDVLDKDINILEAVHVHPTGLRFIPGTVALRQLDTDLQKLRSSLASLDYLSLLDGPPGLNQHVISLIKASDEILVVTNPNLPAVTDAMKIIQTALDMDRSEISIIVNMTHGKHELTSADIEEVCKVPVIGTIPAAYGFKKSLHEKTPLVIAAPYSPAAVAFQKIAAALVGKEYKQPRFLRARQLVSRY